MRLLTFKKPFFFLTIVALSLEASMVSRTQVVMGTFVNIAVEKKNSHFIENGFDIFKDIEASISSYDKNSPIYKLNLKKKSSIDSTTYESFVLSELYYKRTAGYFDISVGSITKDVYNFGANERLPYKNEMRRSSVGFEKIRYTRNEASLSGNIKVDFGGMGKGFAVDKVIAYLENKNALKAIVSASGDIRCLHKCKIDVNNPFSNSPLVSFTTAGENMGVSTSGNYNRYVKSTKYNHLINPKKKQSQSNFISLTLISYLPSVDLDAYTTAASVMPSDMAYLFLKSLETAYIVLHRDGTLVVSKNIKRYVKGLVTEYTREKQPGYIYY